MNRTEFVGRTVKELELRKTQGGTSVVKFTLAVPRRKKGETDWIPCIAYGKTAELLEQYVRKGHRIGVCGHLQTGSYEKEGRKIYTADVIVDEVEFLEKKETEGFVQVQDDGDLPF